MGNMTLTGLISFHQRLVRTMLSAALCLLLIQAACGAGDTRDDDPSRVLTEAQWAELDQATDRALRWMASQQQPDGSFQGPDSGQPGITSLCVMAFVSRGHLPGQGPYGKHLNRAVTFILSCQRQDGLFTKVQRLPPFGATNNAGHAATYNHAIAGLILSELHGMTDDEQRLVPAIDRALAMTCQLQDRPKSRPVEQGGWRYWDYSDADLSITSWQLMFLRSARNAGFDVASERIDRAIQYVHRCYKKDHHYFLYTDNENSHSRAMTGAGILALVHGGKYDDQVAQRAGDYLLARPYTLYLTDEADEGYFHYGVFYTVSAMYMLGGRHWQQFFPQTVHLLLQHQHEEGHWQAEPNHCNYFGNIYTTALVVTALNIPNQLLPIIQR